MIEDVQYVVQNCLQFKFVKSNKVMNETLVN